MSAGVGPPGDITLPKDEVHRTTPTRRSFLTYRQLNALAVVVVLAASGMVSAQDFTFVIFSILYMYFISKTAFPPTSPHSPPPVYGQNNKMLSLYVLVGAVVGLFLPIVYILEGILEGDKEGIKAAAPHLFLLSSQVFMEGLSFSGGFSLPVRVFVPVFYNSMRLSSILEWIGSEMSKGFGGGSSSNRRVYVGRGLAFANMAFWSFNLFGFLLPFYLPKAFKIYYTTKIKD